MKIKAIIFLSALISAPSALSNNITYVYCGLADGSDWEWLLDAHDNYETIYGRWARITEANGQYFNVFRVEEAVFNASAFSCPAGYQVQPAESGTSRWEIFEIIRADGSRYLMDGYKTYYSPTNNRAIRNDSYRL